MAGYRIIGVLDRVVDAIDPLNSDVGGSHEEVYAVIAVSGDSAPRLT